MSSAHNRTELPQLCRPVLCMCVMDDSTYKPKFISVCQVLYHVTCVVNAVTLDICRTLAPHGGRILHYIVSTFLNEQLNCPELAFAILPVDLRHQPGVRIHRPKLSWFNGPWAQLALCSQVHILLFTYQLDCDWHHYVEELTNPRNDPNAWTAQKSWCKAYFISLFFIKSCFCAFTM